MNSKSKIYPIRTTVLERLADLLIGLKKPHPLRVAIDGPDAAGKTTLADELAGNISARGRGVIRASADEFHRPRKDRLARGDGPEAFYRDSFDHEGINALLLKPLGPGGNFGTGSPSLIIG